MKIEFNSDNDLPLNKILKLHSLATFVRYIFEEDSKYYPLFYINICINSEVIDINKTSETKECHICHSWYFLDKDFEYESYQIIDFTIVPMKGSHYRIYFWYMNKDDARNIMNSSNLNEKCGLL